MKRNVRTLLLWLAIVVVAGGLSLMQSGDEPDAAPSSASGAPVVVATQPETAERKQEKWPRVHERITDAVEREQLLATLDLIDRGGPFPYPKKDGSTFGNREARLPAQPRGYYREYTVPTPGASNRGARRVVRGKDGETYYTRDHYETFIRIDR